MKKYHLILLLICLQLVLIAAGALAQTRGKEFNLSFDNINTVEVSGSFCQVNIAGTSGKSSVDFKGEITGLNNRAEIVYEVSGSTLKVWVENEKGWGMNTNGKLYFATPKDIKINVNNSSGGVEVSDIKTELCHLHASSGGIKGSNITANIDVETSSGGIELENIQGNIEGESSSGGQSYQSVKGNIDTESSSGSIDLKDITGNIKVRSTSGGIDLDNTKGSVYAKATSGSIDGDMVYLEGNATFLTSSGGINVDFKNDLKDMSFDLSASSGSIQVGDSRGGDRVILRQGSIQVSGESSSGSQKYY